MSDVPPPGRALPFAERSRVLVERLRELLPGVVVTRRGRSVMIRRPNSARVVKITDNAGADWIATEDVAPIDVAPMLFVHSVL